MRFFAIFMFCFIVNCVIGFVAQLGLWGDIGSDVSIAGINKDTYAENFGNTISNQASGSYTTGSDTSISLGWFSKMYNLIFVLIPTVVNILLDAVVFFPVLWGQLGMPSLLIWSLAPIYYILEGLTIYELVSGRSIFGGG